ncbi:MAG: DUF6503 family protein [Bacteroidota bacterium]
MKHILLLSLLSLFICACNTDATQTAEEQSNEPETPTDPALALIDQSIEAMGGLEAYQKLENVSYKYMRSGEDGPRMISEEIYLYPSEDSYGRYPTANDPDGKSEDKGVLEQIYTDDTVRVRFEGENVANPQAMERARFSRKTNFYWLNMFFKLRDPGLTYELLDDREFDGKTYHAVEVSFEDGVGDVKDIYLVYIDPETKLVDYFLFTVMAAERTEPIMMKVGYKEAGGLLWPIGRSSLASNWEGELPEDAEWPAGVIIEDLKVNSAIDRSVFE